MNLLTKVQQKSYKHAKLCENVKMQKLVNKKLKINMWKIKNIVKLEIIVIIQGNVEVLCMAYYLYYSAPKKNAYRFS